MHWFFFSVLCLNDGESFTQIHSKWKNILGFKKFPNKVDILLVLWHFLSTYYTLWQKIFWGPKFCDALITNIKHPKMHFES